MLTLSIVARLPLALLIALTAGHLALALAATNVFALAVVLLLAGAAAATTLVATVARFATVPAWSTS